MTKVKNAKNPHKEVKPEKLPIKNIAEARVQLRQFMADRKQAYSQLFENHGIASASVLADLSSFCRESESTYQRDPRDHALLEGRREVMLRIRDHMTLSVEDLCKKYGRKELL